MNVNRKKKQKEKRKKEQFHKQLKMGKISREKEFLSFFFSKYNDQSFNFWKKRNIKRKKRVRKKRTILRITCKTIDIFDYSYVIIVNIECKVNKEKKEKKQLHVWLKMKRIQKSFEKKDLNFLPLKAIVSFILRKETKQNKKNHYTND